jgi:hypothetical protein
MVTILGRCLKNNLLVLLLVALTGCAAPYRASSVKELQYIPDDCKNRVMLIGWLENQLEYRKPYTDTQKEYNAQTSAIKAKIWHLRYRCQPA